NHLDKPLKPDFILPNPPFNPTHSRQQTLLHHYPSQFAIPPKPNPNYPSIQHIISKLPPNPTAAFLLANPSISTSRKHQLQIRKNLIQQHLLQS
ncbi:N-6 DNA methylase, partial [Staphylococcus capitis]|uniref:N-6 DNA methylase n=1 Tax=Staphylococcus capitis TaxID=29388 RepID=UPI00119F3170